MGYMRLAYKSVDMVLVNSAIMYILFFKKDMLTLRLVIYTPNKQ